MEWQPIKTAPKDGTRVLLYDPEGTRVFNVAGVVSYEPYMQLGYYDGEWLVHDEQAGGFYLASPTRWFPIPKE